MDNEQFNINDENDKKHIHDVILAGDGKLFQNPHRSTSILL